MNWFKSMNDALKYIEAHIEEDLDSEEIAKIALCSKYHFLRTFTALTGYPLSEYIRNRRLSLAAKELTLDKVKVIDVALKYGYETPEAFTKAFKRLHNITPSMAKKHSSALKAIPPLSFQITIKGDESMEYQIIKKDAFNITGLSRKVTTKNKENYKIIPAFWDELRQKGTLDELDHANTMKKTVLGVCYNMNREQEEFDYMIGIESDLLDISSTTETLAVAPHTWAVFKSVGPMPHAIQNVWTRIFSEWFPATKYEHADAPELEVYYPGDCSQEDYMCEIWIPIVEKKQ